MGLKKCFLLLYPLVLFYFGDIWLLSQMSMCIPVWKHIYESRIWSLNVMILVQSIFWISIQSITFPQEAEKIKKGKHKSKRKTVSLDILRFTTRQRQSSPMRSGMLDGSLALYLRDIEEDPEGIQSLPPPLLWGLDWALQPRANRHAGFLLSRPCFMSGQLNKSPYPPIPSPFSRHWTQLLQRLTPHHHHKFTECG